MDTFVADPAVIDAASNAVTEFLTVAFQEEFLRWDKDLNLGIAEMVWNACSARRDGPVEMGWAPEYQDLVEHLMRVRETRWPRERVLVFDLDARVVDGEIVFSFDLSWDDGEMFQPCEMTWVPRLRDATQTN